MKVGTYHLPLPTGSQVLISNYDMNAYMATLFGGEPWDLCWFIPYRINQHDHILLLLVVVVLVLLLLCHRRCHL